jgi:hypothetical protein
MDLESFLVFVSIENRSSRVAGVFVENASTWPNILRKTT